MKLLSALDLRNGDKVTVKRKNQYTSEKVCTVTETEIVKVANDFFVNIKLDDGKWYGYKEVK